MSDSKQSIDQAILFTLSADRQWTIVDITNYSLQTHTGRSWHSKIISAIHDSPTIIRINLSLTLPCLLMSILCQLPSLSGFILRWPATLLPFKVKVTFPDPWSITRCGYPPISCRYMKSWGALSSMLLTGPLYKSRPLGLVVMISMLVREFSHCCKGLYMA